MELKLVKRKQRGDVYYIEGDIFGDRIKFSTFSKDEKVASSVLGKFISKRTNQYLANDAACPTFDEVAEVHLKSETKSTLYKDEEYIEALKSYIGSLPFSQIRRAVGQPSPLARFIEDRVKVGNSITTVNHHLGLVNTLGKKARDRYGLLKNWTPVYLVQPQEGKKLGLRPPVSKLHLTREMEMILFNQLPVYLRDPVVMAINTGFRERLLCDLRWEWLKKDNSTVWFFEIPKDRMKNGNHLKHDPVFVLNSFAKIILMKRQGNGSEWVFPCDSSLQKSLNGLNCASYSAARARGAFQMPDLARTDVHSFRRTFATRLAEKMIPYEFIQRLMGLKIKSVSEEYIRFSPEMRARMYDYVNMITQGEPAKLRLYSTN